eukprot:500870-Pyramimonas_sp.AAC.1
MKPMLDWLMYDTFSLRDFASKVEEWAGSRSEGLMGLCEFRDFAQQCAKDYMTHVVGTAQLATHRVDVTLSMYIAAVGNQEVDPLRFSQWLRIYPHSGSIAEPEVDTLRDCIRITGVGHLLGHLSNPPEKAYEEAVVVVVVRCLMELRFFNADN